MSIIIFHPAFLLLWGEDLNPGGDIFAEQFWGDIFAELPQHTFFYLDPPYYDIKGYRLNFEAKDFEQLVQVLASVKGKFLMSLNDHKEVRRIFARL